MSATPPRPARSAHRPPVIVAALLALGLSSAPFARPSAAELPTRSEARAVNDHTVGIVFHYENAYRLLIEDMVEAFAKGSSDVRVVPIIGTNHVQTIYDMLYMRGVDLGIVHSDVLEYMARTQGFTRLEQRINALIELKTEKVVVIAGEDYRSLRDLAGKKVNFGSEGRGADITGTILFDAVEIEVETTRLDKLDALEQVKSGEIAAMVYTVSEPLEAFSTLSPADGVRLLGLPQTEPLLEHYREARLTREEFPELIKGEGAVPSLELSVIVAAYNWPASDTWRYEKAKRFAESLLDNMDALREGDSAERWENVSLDTEVPDVPRLAMVDTIVAEREARAEREREEREARAEREREEREAERTAAAAARAAELRADQEALMTRLTERVASGEADPEDIAEMEKLLEQMESILTD